MVDISAARSAATPDRPVANSVMFDGIASIVTCPIVPSVTNFNIAFWAKIATSCSSGGVIMDWESAADRNGYAIKADVSTHTIIAVASTNLAADAILTKPFNYGTWSHIAVTYEVNSFKIYIDGALLGTDTTIVASSNVNALTFGRRAFAGGTNFGKFRMAELTVHNAAAWTLGDVQALMTSGTIPSGASYYGFDGVYTDQNGANALTTSGVGFDGEDVPFPARKLIEG